MEVEEIIEALEPWMKKVRRPAWRPVVEPGDGDPTDSKFCGTAWTSPDSPWPVCAACEKPLSLFLQLRLDDLPGSLDRRYGTGLLQLFYCPRAGSCGGDNGYQAFASQVSHVRVISPTPDGESAPPPPNVVPLPTLQITGWTRFDDLPDAQEHEEHGLKSTYDFQVGTIRLECPEIGFDVTEPEEECQIEDIAAAADNDKLAGWPMWVQGVEYPSCPRCRRRMIPVFQLGPHDHVDFSFGDMGTGHVTQCPEHKDVVAFGWACG